MLVSTRALALEAGRDERVALRGSGGSLSYSALRTQAEGVARHSAAWSGHDDDRSPYVALLADWTPEFVACFLGLASAGWAVGVLDSSWSDEELRGAVAQLNPCAVVVGDGHAAGGAVLAADGWVATGQIDQGWCVLTRGPSATPRPAPAAVADGAFYVGFTSGSSGRPKAFVRSHRSWWESFERFATLCPIDPEGAVLVPGPLSSSHFMFGALHALHCGATVELVASSEYSPEHVADRISRFAPLAGLYVVPTMLAQHAHGAPPPGTSDPAYVFCAGARLEAVVRQRAAERFPSTCLVEYYGASELSFVAIQVGRDGTPPGSVGRAFPGVDVSIRDDDDQPVEDGAEGTVFARSELVFMGYRGQAPESGARSIDDGWVTVGDRGSLDAEGFLSIAGRGSSLIITGGANVQPEEVEEVIAACDGIAACAVVGLADQRWGELVCAAIVVAPHAEVRRSDIRRHVAARLARYKRPRRYVTVDGPLPVGRTGKVDREAVRRLVVDRQTRDLR